MSQQQPNVQEFFDLETNTFSYVVTDIQTQKCAIIDSVLDYDVASATTSTDQADKIIAYIRQNSLSVAWILETHVHADHLTASQYLKKQLGGKIAMSRKIAIVQETFSQIYNLDMKYFNLHQSFDYLFEDNEHFKIGDLDAYNIPTPGHTPACLSYVVGDAVFVGDTLLCQIMVQHVVIFQKEVHPSYLIRYNAYIIYQTLHECFYVMTIYPVRVMIMYVKQISILKSLAIFISMKECLNWNLLKCVRPEMQRLLCQN